MTQQPTDNPFVIGPRDGFTPRVGVLVSCLQNTRHYLRNAMRDLSLEQLDARPQRARNTIGQLLAHVAAAETMFQRLLFKGRRFNNAERERWGACFEFGDSVWSHGRSLEAYLHDLDAARAHTLEGLKTRDDAWLDTPRPFAGHPANHHYFWFHFLQDEARHTGQIILLRKHLIPQAEPDFEPYFP